MQCPVPVGGQRIEVGVGELAVARAPDVLVTSALGSCIGVALWDAFTQSGGLAHVMLPDLLEGGRGDADDRYASIAIPRMVRMLSESGAPSFRLVAKIAGGASMFGADSAVANVGERNLAAVRKHLEAAGVEVVAEDVGGSHARTVELRLDSGTLVVRSYVYGVREL